MQGGAPQPKKLTFIFRKSPVAVKSEQDHTSHGGDDIAQADEELAIADASSQESKPLIPAPSSNETLMYDRLRQTNTRCSSLCSCSSYVPECALCMHLGNGHPL